MKKLFTILCAAILSLGVSAQTESGTILIEGGSNFSYSSVKVNSASFDGEDLDIEDQDATNSMKLNLIGGYFMMDGLAAGLLFDYSSVSVDGEGSSTMLIGPIVRYYIGESGMWGQLSYGLGSSNDGDSDTDEPTSSRLGIGVGYAAMLSDNISLSPSIGYAMITEKMDDFEVKSGGIVFKVGIAVHLGN
ncbi:porin family protein [Flavobacteriales bacterium]|jgi:hypothetical protein|nr:porin family protein [Flavobacteriales bacterium]